MGLAEVLLQITPARIISAKGGQSFDNIKDIAAGSNHSIALNNKNRVFSWGNGQGGRLGHRDEKGESIPKEILAMRDIKPTNIYAGDSHSGCISASHEAYTWGVGSYGRLGHGNQNN